MDHDHRSLLKDIAHKAMIERGLLPDFSPEVLDELNRLVSTQLGISPLDHADGRFRDLRNLLWSSIDNDDSLDLDQLTVAEQASADNIRVLVAIADVDSEVKKGTAIDKHAGVNTTSVYTAAEIFPMLPVKISNGLTSLNLGEDRQTIVVEMLVGPEGSLTDSGVYRAIVSNKAKLAYNSVAAWLDGRGDIPPAISTVSGLAENLHLQDQAAQRIKDFRHDHGALSLETIESKPVFDGDQIMSMEVEEKNRAKEIIEDFMIAANGVTARFLTSKKFPSIRRVVRMPKRWDRIVQIAADHKYNLPAEPNSKALEDFLVKQRVADPIRFPDLSLSVIKLLGAGEYMADYPDGDVPGHFGLAVKDYGHSTAPNRRYPDLLTQRLLKAALSGEPIPYSKNDLESLALHCTQAEDAANKVERQVEKSAAALLLESRIGEIFDAIATGASDKGTWVRLLNFPVEGRVVQGYDGVDVGDRIRVRLVSVDVMKGYIDFRRNGSGGG